MKNPPKIQAAHVIEHGVLEVHWSTGETLRVNLADLPKCNTTFAPLTDPDFFARMERDEWGHGLDWPGGLDLGADRLYELCRKQAHTGSKPIPKVVDVPECVPVCLVESAISETKPDVAYDLNELLGGITVVNLHAEVSFGKPVGKEVF